MRLKKLILMSSGVIGVGLIAPVAMQISRSQNKTNKVNSNVKLSDNQYRYTKGSRTTW